MPEYQTRKQKRGKDRGNGKLLHRRGQQDVAADDRGELHQIPARYRFVITVRISEDMTCRNTT